MLSWQSISSLIQNRASWKEATKLPPPSMLVPEAIGHIFATAMRWKLFDFRCALTKHGTAGGKVQNTLTKQLQKIPLYIDAADASDLRSVQVHFAAHALPCWAATKRLLKYAAPEKTYNVAKQYIWASWDPGSLTEILGQKIVPSLSAGMAEALTNLQDFWPCWHNCEP